MASFDNSKTLITNFKSILSTDHYHRNALGNAVRYSYMLNVLNEADDYVKGEKKPGVKNRFEREGLTLESFTNALDDDIEQVKAEFDRDLESLKTKNTGETKNEFGRRKANTLYNDRVSATDEISKKEQPSATKLGRQVARAMSYNASGYFDSTIDPFNSASNMFKAFTGSFVLSDEDYFGSRVLYDNVFGNYVTAEGKLNEEHVKSLSAAATTETSDTDAGKTVGLKNLSDSTIQNIVQRAQADQANVLRRLDIEFQRFHGESQLDTLSLTGGAYSAARQLLNDVTRTAHQVQIQSIASYKSPLMVLSAKGTNQDAAKTAIEIINKLYEGGSTEGSTGGYVNKSGIAEFVDLFNTSEKEISISTFQFQNEAISASVKDVVKRRVLENAIEGKGNTDKDKFTLNLTLGIPRQRTLSDIDTQDDFRYGVGTTNYAILGPNLIEALKLNEIKEELIEEFKELGLDPSQLDNLLNINIQFKDRKYHPKIYYTDKMGAIGTQNLTNPVGNSINQAGSNFEVTRFFQNKYDVDDVGATPAYVIGDINKQDAITIMTNKDIRESLLYRQLVQVAEQDRMHNFNVAGGRTPDMKGDPSIYNNRRGQQIGLAGDIYNHLKNTLDYAIDASSLNSGRFSVIGEHTPINGNLHMFLILDQTFILQKDSTSFTKMISGEMGSEIGQPFGSGDNAAVRFQNMQSQVYDLLISNRASIVADGKNFTEGVYNPIRDKIMALDDNSLAKKNFIKAGGSLKLLAGYDIFVGSSVIAGTKDLEGKKEQMRAYLEAQGFSGEEFDLDTIMGLASGNVKKAKVPRQHAKMFGLVDYTKGSDPTLISYYMGSSNLGLYSLGISSQDIYNNYDKLYDGNGNLVNTEVGIMLAAGPIRKMRDNVGSTSVMHHTVTHTETYTGEYSLTAEQERDELQLSMMHLVQTWNHLTNEGDLNGGAHGKVSTAPLWQDNVNTGGLLVLKDRMEKMAKTLGVSESVFTITERLGDNSGSGITSINLTVDIAKAMNGSGIMHGSANRLPRLNFELSVLNGPDGKPGFVYFVDKNKVVGNALFVNNSKDNVSVLGRREFNQEFIADLEGGRIDLASGQSAHLTALDAVPQLFATLVGEAVSRFGPMAALNDFNNQYSRQSIIAAEYLSRRLLDIGTSISNNEGSDGILTSQYFSDGPKAKDNITYEAITGVRSASEHFTKGLTLANLQFLVGQLSIDLTSQEGKISDPKSNALFKQKEKAYKRLIYELQTFASIDIKERNTDDFINKILPAFIDVVRVSPQLASQVMKFGYQDNNERGKLNAFKEFQSQLFGGFLQAREDRTYGGQQGTYRTILLGLVNSDLEEGVLTDVNKAEEDYRNLNAFARFMPLAYKPSTNINAFLYRSIASKSTAMSKLNSDLDSMLFGQEALDIGDAQNLEILSSVGLGNIDKISDYFVINQKTGAIEKNDDGSFKLRQDQLDIFKRKDGSYNLDAIQAHKQNLYKLFYSAEAIAKATTDKVINEEQLSNIGYSQQRLQFYTGDTSKLSQLPQRIKNATGGRPLYQYGVESQLALMGLKGLDGKTEDLLSDVRKRYEENVFNKVRASVKQFASTYTIDTNSEGIATEESLSLVQRVASLQTRTLNNATAMLGSTFKGHLKAVLNSQQIRKVEEIRTEITEIFKYLEFSVSDEEKDKLKEEIIRIEILKTGFNSSGLGKMIVGSDHTKYSIALIQLSGTYTDTFLANPTYGNVYEQEGGKGRIIVEGQAEGYYETQEKSIKSSMMGMGGMEVLIREDDKVTADPTTGGFVHKRYNVDTGSWEIVNVTDDRRNLESIKNVVDNTSHSGINSPSLGTQPTTSYGRQGEQSVDYIADVSQRAGNFANNEYLIDITRFRSIMAGSGRRVEGTDASALIKGVANFAGNVREGVNLFTDIADQITTNNAQGSLGAYVASSSAKEVDINGNTYYTTLGSSIQGLYNANNLKSYVWSHGATVLRAKEDGDRFMLNKVLEIDSTSNVKSRQLIFGLVSSFGDEFIKNSLGKESTEYNNFKQGIVKSILEGEFGDYYQKLAIAKSIDEAGSIGSESGKKYATYTDFIYESIVSKGGGLLSSLNNQKSLFGLSTLDATNILRIVSGDTGNQNQFIEEIENILDPTIKRIDAVGAANLDSSLDRQSIQIVTALDLVKQLTSRASSIKLPSEIDFQNRKVQDVLLTAIGLSSTEMSDEKRREELLGFIAGLGTQVNAIALFTDISFSLTKDPTGTQSIGKLEGQHLIDPFYGDLKQFKSRSYEFDSEGKVTHVNEGGQISKIQNVVASLAALTSGRNSPYEMYDSLYKVGFSDGKAVNLFSSDAGLFFTSFYQQKYVGFYQRGNLGYYTNDLAKEYKSINQELLKSGGIYSSNMNATVESRAKVDKFIDQILSITGDTEKAGYKTQLENKFYAMDGAEFAMYELNVITEQMIQLNQRYQANPSKQIGKETTAEFLKSMSNETMFISMPKINISNQNGQIIAIADESNLISTIIPSAMEMRTLGSQYTDFVDPIIGHYKTLISIFTPGTLENQAFERIRSATMSGQGVVLDQAEAKALMNIYNSAELMPDELQKAIAGARMQEATGGKTKFKGMTSTGIANMMMPFGSVALPFSKLKDQGMYELEFLTDPPKPGDVTAPLPSSSKTVSTVSTDSTPSTEEPEIKTERRKITYTFDKLKPHHQEELRSEYDKKVKGSTSSKSTAIDYELDNSSKKENNVGDNDLHLDQKQTTTNKEQEGFYAKKIESGIRKAPLFIDDGPINAKFSQKREERLRLFEEGKGYLPGYANYKKGIIVAEDYVLHIKNKVNRIDELLKNIGNPNLLLSSINEFSQIIKDDFSDLEFIKNNFLFDINSEDTFNEFKNEFNKLYTALNNNIKRINTLPFESDTKKSIYKIRQFNNFLQNDLVYDYGIIYAKDKGSIMEVVDKKVFRLKKIKLNEESNLNEVAFNKPTSESYEMDKDLTEDLWATPVKEPTKTLKPTSESYEMDKDLTEDLWATPVKEPTKTLKPTFESLKPNHQQELKERYGVKTKEAVTTVVEKTYSFTDLRPEDQAILIKGINKSDLSPNIKTLANFTYTYLKSFGKDLNSVIKKAKETQNFSSLDVSNIRVFKFIDKNNSTKIQKEFIKAYKDLSGFSSREKRLANAYDPNKSLEENAIELARVFNSSIVMNTEDNVNNFIKVLGGYFTDSPVLNNTNREPSAEEVLDFVRKNRERYPEAETKTVYVDGEIKYTPTQAHVDEITTKYSSEYSSTNSNKTVSESSTAIPKVVGYKTELGSVYIINDQGQSQRYKQFREKHGLVQKGNTTPEFGKQEVSPLTVFVDESAAVYHLGIKSTQGGIPNTNKVLIIDTDSKKAKVITIGGQDGSYLGQNKTIVDVSPKPTIGLYPVEFYNAGDFSNSNYTEDQIKPNVDLQSPVGNRVSVDPKVHHAGNKVVEIFTDINQLNQEIDAVRNKNAEEIMKLINDPTFDQSQVDFNNSELISALEETGLDIRIVNGRYEAIRKSSVSNKSEYIPTQSDVDDITAKYRLEYPEYEEVEINNKGKTISETELTEEELYNWRRKLPEVNAKKKVTKEKDELKLVKETIKEDVLDKSKSVMSANNKEEAESRYELFKKGEAIIPLYVTEHIKYVGDFVREMKNKFEEVEINLEILRETKDLKGIKSVDFIKDRNKYKSDRTSLIENLFLDSKGTLKKYLQVEKRSKNKNKIEKAFRTLEIDYLESFISNLLYEFNNNKEEFKVYKFIVTNTHKRLFTSNEVKESSEYRLLSSMITALNKIEFDDEGNISTKNIDFKKENVLRSVQQYEKEFYDVLEDRSEEEINERARNSTAIPTLAEKASIINKRPASSSSSYPPVMPSTYESKGSSGSSENFEGIRSYGLYVNKETYGKLLRYSDASELTPQMYEAKKEEMRPDDYTIGKTYKGTVKKTREVDKPIYEMVTKYKPDRVGTMQVPNYLGEYAFNTLEERVEAYETNIEVPFYFDPDKKIYFLEDYLNSLDNLQHFIDTTTSMLKVKKRRKGDGSREINKLKLSDTDNSPEKNAFTFFYHKNKDKSKSHTFIIDGFSISDIYSMIYDIQTEGDKNKLLDILSSMDAVGKINSIQSILVNHFQAVKDTDPEYDVSYKNAISSYFNEISKFKKLLETKDLFIEKDGIFQFNKDSKTYKKIEESQKEYKVKMKWRGESYQVEERKGTKKVTEVYETLGDIPVDAKRAAEWEDEFLKRHGDSFDGAKQIIKKSVGTNQLNYVDITDNNKDLVKKIKSFYRKQEQVFYNSIDDTLLKEYKNLSQESVTINNRIKTLDSLISSGNTKKAKEIYKGLVNELKGKYEKYYTQARIDSKTGEIRKDPTGASKTSEDLYIYQQAALNTESIYNYLLSDDKYSAIGGKRSKEAKTRYEIIRATKSLMNPYNPFDDSEVIYSGLDKYDADINEYSLFTKKNKTAGLANERSLVNLHKRTLDAIEKAHQRKETITSEKLDAEAEAELKEELDVRRKVETELGRKAQINYVSSLIKKTKELYQARLKEAEDFSKYRESFGSDSNTVENKIKDKSPIVDDATNKKLEAAHQEFTKRTNALITKLEQIENNLSSRSNPSLHDLKEVTEEIDLAVQRYDRSNMELVENFRSPPPGGTDPRLHTYRVMQGVYALNRVAQAIQDNRTDGGLQMKYDESRGATGTYMQALGIVTYGLGDYDGDSYTSIFHQQSYLINAYRIAENKVMALEARNKAVIDTGDTSLYAGKGLPDLEKELLDAKRDLAKKGEALSKGIEKGQTQLVSRARTLVSNYLGIDERHFVAEGEQLKDQFGNLRFDAKGKAITGLGAYTYDADSLFVYIEQGYKLIEGLESNSSDMINTINSMDRLFGIRDNETSTRVGISDFYTALTKAVSDASRDISGFDSVKSELLNKISALAINATGMALNDGEKAFFELLQTEEGNGIKLVLARELFKAEVEVQKKIESDYKKDVSMTEEERRAAIRKEQMMITIGGEIFSTIMSDKTMGKMIKQGTGMNLTESSFDMMLKTLGTAGGEILGKTYNAIISTTFQDAPILSYGRQIVDSNNDLHLAFMEYFALKGKTLDKATVTSRIAAVEKNAVEANKSMAEIRSAIRDEYTKIMNEQGTEGEFDEYIKLASSAVHRSEDVQGFFKNIHQLLRDSIKLKGDNTSIVNDLEEYAESYNNLSKQINANPTPDLIKARDGLVTTMASKLGPGPGLKSLINLDFLTTNSMEKGLSLSDFESRFFEATGVSTDNSFINTNTFQMFAGKYLQSGVLTQEQMAELMDPNRMNSDEVSGLLSMARGINANNIASMVTSFNFGNSLGKGASNLRDLATTRLKAIKEDSDTKDFDYHRKRIKNQYGADYTQGNDSDNKAGVYGIDGFTTLSDLKKASLSNNGSIAKEANDNLAKFYSNFNQREALRQHLGLSLDEAYGPEGTMTKTYQETLRKAAEKSAVSVEDYLLVFDMHYSQIIDQIGNVFGEDGKKMEGFTLLNLVRKNVSNAQLTGNAMGMKGSASLDGVLYSDLLTTMAQLASQQKLSDEGIDVFASMYRGVMSALIDANKDSEGNVITIDGVKKKVAELNPEEQKQYIETLLYKTIFDVGENEEDITNGLTRGTSAEANEFKRRTKTIIMDAEDKGIGHIIQALDEAGVGTLSDAERQYFEEYGLNMLFNAANSDDESQLRKIVEEFMPKDPTTGETSETYTTNLTSQVRKQLQIKHKAYQREQKITKERRNRLFDTTKSSSMLNNLGEEAINYLSTNKGANILDFIIPFALTGIGHAIQDGNANINDVSNLAGTMLVSSQYARVGMLDSVDRTTYRRGMMITSGLAGVSKIRGAVHRYGSDNLGEALVASVGQEMIAMAVNQTISPYLSNAIAKNVVGVKSSPVIDTFKIKKFEAGQQIAGNISASFISSITSTVISGLLFRHAFNKNNRTNVAEAIQEFIPAAMVVPHVAEKIARRRAEEEAYEEEMIVETSESEEEVTSYMVITKAYYDESNMTAADLAEINEPLDLEPSFTGELEFDLLS